MACVNYEIPLIMKKKERKKSYLFSPTFPRILRSCTFSFVHSWFKLRNKIYSALKCKKGARRKNYFRKWAARAIFFSSSFFERAFRKMKKKKKEGEESLSFLAANCTFHNVITRAIKLSGLGKKKFFGRAVTFKLSTLYISI